MSHAGSKNHPRPRLRWWQFSLGSLFVALTVAAILAAWYASRNRPPETVRVRIAQASASVDSRIADDFPSLLADRVERLRSDGLDPAAVTVLAQVDDDTNYRHVRHVLRECWHAGLRTFVLDRNGQRREFDVDMPVYSNERLLDPPEEFLELLDVKLWADKRGALARMTVGSDAVDGLSEQPFVQLKSLVSLKLPLSRFGGVCIHADDTLAFGYVAASMEALGLDIRDGKQRPLPSRLTLGIATLEELLPGGDDMLPDIDVFLW